ncbi:MAG: DUF2279 domain-containing protein [Chitinophagaceae bacterium]
MLPAPVQNSAPVVSLTSAFGNSIQQKFLRKQTSQCKNSKPLWLLDYTAAPLHAILSLFFFLIIFNGSLFAQDTISNPNLQQADTTTKSIPHKKRQHLIITVNILGYGGSLIILNNTWYKNYPRTSFHTFNDSKEWLQVDKVGHAWTAYNTGKVSAGMWRWAGLSNEKAVIIGGASGAAYLTVIEFLDAHSAKWGWSWADMGANIFGSSLFIAQELSWKEQHIQFKFSFHKKNYPDVTLEKRADDLFGKTWYERMLKDYNGQTYWLSTNLHSFFQSSKIPKWLNVAVGYGAEGLFGGFENKWTDGDPGFPINRTDVKRQRQFYIAPDIDFTKIKTNSKFLRTAFYFLNAFKFPAPAIEFSDKIKLKAVAF